MIAKRKCQKEEQLKRYSNVQSFARIIQTTESKKFKGKNFGSIIIFFLNLIR